MNIGYFLVGLFHQLIFKCLGKPTFILWLVIWILDYTPWQILIYTFCLVHGSTMNCVVASNPFLGPNTLVSISSTYQPIILQFLKKNSKGGCVVVTHLRTLIQCLSTEHCGEKARYITLPTKISKDFQQLCILSRR